MPDFGGAPRLAARGDTVHPMAKTLLLALFPCALLAADEMTVYDLLAPATHSFNIVYDVSAIQEGFVVVERRPFPPIVAEREEDSRLAVSPERSEEVPIGSEERRRHQKGQHQSHHATMIPARPTRKA